MVNTRESGYYFCKEGEDWEIAYWDNDIKLWYCIATQKRFTDAIWTEIDPTPIKPKENE